MLIAAILFNFLFVLVALANQLLDYEYFDFESAKLGPIDEHKFYVLYDLYCAGFSTILLILSSIVPKKESLKRDSFLQNNSADYYLNWLAIFQVLGVLFFILSTGFGSLNPMVIALNIIEGGRFSYWTNSGHNQSLMNLSFYLANLSVVYFFYETKFKCRSKIRLAICLVCILAMIVFTGARGWLIGAASGTFMAILLFRNPNKYVMLFSGGFVILFLIMFQVIRQSWTLDINIHTFLEVLIQGDLSWFYYASLEAIRQYEMDLQFYPLNFLRQILFLPIPNEFTFGLKERDLPFLFESAIEYSSHVRGGNFPPGLFGVFVLNFGHLGIILGPAILLGCIYMMERAFYKKSPYFEAFVAIFPLFILQLYRGSMMGIYYWFFLIIVMFGILVTRKMLLSKFSKAK